MNFFDLNNTISIILGYPVSYVEFIATLTGLISVWLAAKNNIWTWIIGFINIICFFVIFFQVQLYSDMFLQVYFFIASIYGLYIWKKKNEKSNSISLLSNQHRLFILFLLVVFTIIIGYLIKNIHLYLPTIFSKEASFPYTDTFVALSSIIATILLAKKIIENWMLWILVDIICVFLYAKKNIMFISIEYAIFFCIASYGFYSWVKLFKDEKRIDYR